MRTRVVLLVCLLLGLNLVGQEAPAKPAPAPATPPSAAKPETTAQASAPGLSVRDAAWLMLIRGAAEDKTEKRMEALSALGTIRRNQEALKFLETALSDKDRDVRQMAATTLGEIRSRSSVPKLKQALDDDAPEVVFAAARSLWMLGERSGRGVLEEVLSGERSASRGAVSENMKRIRTFLTDPKGLVLFGVREGVGSIAGPYMMGMHVVDEFTKDRSAAARVLSANMLATDPSKEAYTVLIEALRDKSWVVRMAAAKAVGVRGDRRAITALQENIQDEDEKSAVKLMCAAAIINLSR